jgi:hypothetical protein
MVEQLCSSPRVAPRILLDLVVLVLVDLVVQKVIPHKQLEANMSISKSIPTDSVDDHSSPVIAAIRTLRQTLEHELDALTADWRAVARTEQLIVAHQLPTSSSSGGRDSVGAVPSSPDFTTGCSALPNGLRNAICVVADSLPAKFTAAEVLVRLEGQGFKFTRNPAAAVRDALYALCHGKRPRLRVSEPGKGGKENLYERNQQV